MPDLAAIRARLALYRGPVDHAFLPVDEHAYPRFCARCGGSEHVHLYREHVAALLAALDAREGEPLDSICHDCGAKRSNQHTPECPEYATREECIEAALDAQAQGEEEREQ